MMTPDELHAKGYSIQYATWGVHVFYSPTTYLVGSGVSDSQRYRYEEGISVDEVQFTVQFNQPLSDEESQRRGWEAAEADFVMRRLEG